MSDLKSKYKATDVAVLKNKIKNEDKTLSSGKSDYLTIDDGTNKFRLYPKHPGEESFYQTRAVHWITVEDDEGEEKRTTVYNSRIHGGTKLDIIEEYIKTCKAKYEDSDDDDALDKLKAITDWKRGLMLSTSWICYAVKLEKSSDGKTESTFGFWEFNKIVRDGLNKIATVEDDDEPIEIDPFTDPDDGIPVLYTYTPKKGKNKAKRDVQLAKKPYPLSDDQLEDFDKVKPLSSLFRNNYTIVDFEKALEGLEFFDKENDMEVFESDEFTEVIAKVKKQYSSKKATTSVDDEKPAKKSKKVVDEDDEKPAKKAKKVVEDEEEEDEKPLKKKKDPKQALTDTLEGMDREELKEHIGEEELEVKVFKSMSDDDIREAILKAVFGEDKEEEEEEDEKPLKKKAVKEDADDEKPAKKKVPTLDDIKKQLEGNKSSKKVVDDDDED